jgi:hypothetical protein
MRTRHPFEDVSLEFELPEAAREFVEPGSPLAELLPSLGFRQHQGENRKTRRAAVANWQPSQTNGAAASAPAAGSRAPDPVKPAAAPTERMPTRRELLKQRQRNRRGELDVELRRLQRKATR